jgi:hypothetical protein
MHRCSEPGTVSFLESVAMGCPCMPAVRSGSGPPTWMVTPGIGGGGTSMAVPSGGEDRHVGSPEQALSHC